MDDDTLNEAIFEFRSDDCKLTVCDYADIADATDVPLPQCLVLTALQPNYFKVVIDAQVCLLAARCIY